ncbi:MAG: peptidylprolyl isomerase [Elusimicrobia bacterium]|nr:peptidylprolyl isomerase [Candidatus Obscuribacterium magneticum]
MFKKAPLIASLLVFLGSFIAYAELVGKILATVNGDPIYSSEFDRNWESILDQKKKISPNSEITPEWESDQKKILLDQMIEERLLLQEAKRKGMKVPKRQLEEGLLQVKNRFKVMSPGAKPTKADFERPLTLQETVEFQKELKTQDMTEKEFESRIEGQLQVMLLTEEEVQKKIPSPFKGGDKIGEDEEGKPRDLTPDYEEDAKTLYKEIEKKYNDENFKPDPDNEVDQMAVMLKSKLDETVHARHILVRSNRDDDFKKRSMALNKIKSIKKELDDGADFVEMAQKYNEEPAAKNGGDLGFFTKSQMVPEFEKAAFGLPVGGISDVVETQFGYHILKVEEKRAAQRLRFDDIKMDLAGYLYQKKAQKKYEVYIDEIKKKATIKILYEFGKKGG